MSKALDDMQGSSKHAAQSDGSHLVVLRHERLWLVCFRLVLDGGTWAVSEMAVRYAGSGGTTGEAIRRLPIGGLLKEARRLVGRSAASSRGRLTRPSKVRLAPFLRDGRGGFRRPDADYANLAVEYLLRVRDGDRSPAKSLHEELGFGSPAVWANRIGEARRRRLLTKGRPGEPGGRLTAKAERLHGLDDETGEV